MVVVPPRNSARFSRPHAPYIFAKVISKASDYLIASSRNGSDVKCGHGGKHSPLDPPFKYRRRFQGSGERSGRETSSGSSSKLPRTVSRTFSVEKLLGTAAVLNAFPRKPIEPIERNTHGTHVFSLSLSQRTSTIKDAFSLQRRPRRTTCLNLLFLANRMSSCSVRVQFRILFTFGGPV